MRIAVRTIVIITFLLLNQTFSFSQVSDAGAIGSISVTKDAGRNWDFKLEEELRFNQSFSVFNRSLTSVSAGYSILPKYLKAGISYDFIRQNKDLIYDFRHRGSFSLTGQLKSGMFDFHLRTLIQTTRKQEDQNNQSFNLKTTWRNKLECTYNIFGSPLKPSFSVETFCPTNDPGGCYIDSYRLKSTLRYRYSQHQSIDVFVRYDQEVQQKNPKSILYIGAGWNYKL